MNPCARQLAFGFYEQAELERSSVFQASRPLKLTRH